MEPIGNLELIGSKTVDLHVGLNEEVGKKVAELAHHGSDEFQYLIVHQILKRDTERYVVIFHVYARRHDPKFVVKSVPVDNSDNISDIIKSLHEVEETVRRAKGIKGI